MKTKILKCLIMILFLGLFTASIWAESPNPTVTVSGITYKGPDPNVTVSNIVYKGKEISVGKAPSMEISDKRNLMKKQVKIVLLSPRDKTFKIGARVPIKFAVNNPPEAISEPAFEFQQLNGRTWRKIHGQRVTGNLAKRSKDKITLTRYVEFRKAGVYRWRCRINRGVWSVWSNPVTISGPGARATQPNSNPVREGSSPGRATNTRQ
ncbi:MAG: hypothetical protein K8R67_16545 [Desulfobacteraceae bacterium]|nr:hypothetical protein [Desulfobacteraceae bacterium]